MLRRDSSRVVGSLVSHCRRGPRHWVAAVVAILCLAAETTSADEKPVFEFRKNDVVAVYGNGLADRMQHAPWVETVLQNRLAGLDVRFRDLGFAGDTVNARPREQGFIADPAYLDLVDPSVIFLFYGYNESYNGPGGADAYREELVKAVENYRKLRAEKGKEVRFVLFSPIAFENTGDPNLPDGTQHNASLAAYTAATRRAAEESKATFVDLYSPTFQLFASSSERFTLNGCHLNDAGYRRLADMIAEALVGRSVAADADLSRIHAAVIDKNWHWHNRFRATDGNDIWGSRAGLTFVDGQSNAEVLMHELKMLDVMTANRDPAIWAAVAGRPYTVDDGNVPAPIPVKSNVGGGSQSSSKDKEGSVEYLSPRRVSRRSRCPRASN